MMVLALILPSCVGSEFEPSRASHGDGDGDLGGSASGGTGDGDGGTGGDASTACDPECTGDTPICDEDAKTCVECLEESDCTDGLCDTSNECVECLENTDCTGAEASLCDEGSCAGCTQDDECTHITDLNACDADAKTCVECTDSADCGGNPCNPVTHTCSAYGMDRRTCESCDTDENCDTADNFCVPMNYDGTERGGYCLKTAPDCTPPYMTLAAGRTTRSGVSGQNYCSINEALATCEAVRGLIDGVECLGGMDSECPESGTCQDIGGTATNRCTYRCTGVDDCKESGAGSTCGAAPNDFCGYVP